jgi:homogentisate phytyltransferase/homogentisate geranylgeranyltransferase
MHHGVESSVATLPARVSGRAAVLWRFGRPHTLVGTVVGVLGLFALAVQDSGAGVGQALFHLWWTLVAALSVNVFIVGINQVEDVEIDRVNKPFLPIAAGDLSIPVAWRVVALTAVLPLALAVTQGWVELVAVAVALAVGWAYSCPPVRLKRFPLAAATAITLVRAGVVNLGVWWHFSTALRGEEAIHPAVWVLLGVTVPFAFAIAVLKDVPDLEGDRRHGISTFTVRLGPARALRLGIAALILVGVGSAAVAFTLLDPGVAVAVALLNAAGLTWLVRRAPAGRDVAPHEVAPFYRDVWRLFFCEYVMVPAAFLLS